METKTKRVKTMQTISEHDKAIEDTKASEDDKASEHDKSIE